MVLDLNPGVASPSSFDSRNARVDHAHHQKPQGRSILQLTYKSELFEALAELSGITEVFRICKTNDGLEIKAGDSAESIVYHLIAPKEYLEIPDDIAFNNFTQFYNKFSLFEKPDLEIDDRQSCLSFRSGSRVATHNLAILDHIKTRFNVIDFPSIDAQFNLTAQQLKQMRSLSGQNYFDSDRIELKFGSQESKFILCSTKHEDKMEDDLNVDMFDAESDFSFKIDIKAIQSLPAEDYRVTVCKRGIVRFDMIRTGDIKVILYTAKLKEKQKKESK